MKTSFTISRNKLLAALLRCKHAINARMAMPILTNYLFSFEDDRLIVWGSDFDITIHESLPLCEEEGTEGVSFALDRYYLLNAIKSLDDQPLRFEVMDYQVKVTHGCGSFWIQRGDAESVLPDVIKRESWEYWCKECDPDVNGITLEIPGIKHWISLTANSMADDFLRPAMNCVCMDFLGNKKMNISASDGHQLTVIEKELDYASFECRLQIPRKMCHIIRTCLPNTGMVDLKFTEYKHWTDKDCKEHTQKSVGLFTVELDNEDPEHLLYIRFHNEGMDGRFPNYMSVIPSDFNYQLECDRKMLIKSLDRMIQFTNRKTNMLRFTLESEKMQISGQDNDFEVGANEELPCTFKDIKGEDMYKPDMRIAFNGSSLASLLKRLTTEKVVISYVDRSRPCIIQPQPQSGVEKVTFLLMPMYAD